VPKPQIYTFDTDDTDDGHRNGLLYNNNKEMTGVGTAFRSVEKGGLRSTPSNHRTYGK
jgi:hypothetical protein